MDKPKWFKFKTKWSSGTDKEWEWREWSSADGLEEQIDSENNWSEHYRGCIVRAGSPPKSILVKEIDATNSRIRELMARTKRLKGILAGR